MSQQKILAAQELIAEKRFDEARSVLRTVNSREARKLLAKLN